MRNLLINRALAAKKKKIFTLFLALVASVGTTFAVKVQIGDLYYNLTYPTAEVARYYSVSGDITIPPSVTYNSVSYSVTSIGEEAFSGCSGLTSVTIPNSVTSIGGSAFSGCSGLTSVTIPNSVTSIGGSAFFGCESLTSVTIPNSVPSIGSSAFMACTGLISITIGNSVASIGNGAFGGCSSLTSVIWNAKNYADFASNNTPFYDLRSQITSFTFGNEVEHIPAYLCYGMSNLTSVTIGNSVTSIGEYAFWNCKALTSITIPNSVTSIGEWAFSYCESFTSVTIPNSVTSIGDGAFLGCTNLTSVIGPAGVFNVRNPDGAKMSHFLQSITITGGELPKYFWTWVEASHKTLKYLNIAAVSNTTIDDEALKGCFNLTDVVWPANLERIGYMSVAECIKLQSVTLPASVTEIDDRAFENCRSLKSITFGGQQTNIPGRLNAPAVSESRLQRIGNWAFYNCHELQNLTIPEGVKEIGDGAFYGCVYMENLILPASVRAIGDNTFALCSKLQKIEVRSATPPEIEQKTFYDVQRRIPVYVPDDSVDAYKDDALWGEFNIQGESGMLMDIPTVSASAAQSQVQKIMQNGQLYILRDGKVYNATGAEVK